MRVSLLVLLLGLLAVAWAIDTSIVQEVGTESEIDASIVQEVGTESEVEMESMTVGQWAAAHRAEAEAEAEAEANLNANVLNKNIFKKAKQGLQKLGNNIKAAVKKTGDKIKASAKKTGQKIKAAVKKTGDKIKAAAKKIKDKIVQLFEPSINIGPHYSQVPNFDEVIAQDSMAMCSIAYCPADKLRQWKCQDCNTLKLHGHHIGTTKDSTQVVVASNKAKNAIYVSFRGTITTLAQWANNLKFTQVNWPGKNCPGCKVHKGFYEVFTQIRDPTIALIKKAAKEFPTADIFLTGHSKGGAIAMLLGKWLHSELPQFTPTQMYTVGTPRTGNAAFANAVNAAFGNNNYRLKNRNDMIPTIPFQKMGGGYKHTGTLVMCRDKTRECYVGSRNQENPSAKSELLQMLKDIWQAAKNHLYYFNNGIGSSVGYKCG